ncbi:MAG: hypothetical protein IBX57_00705 [Gammaproteobacteria bacterium]|nr:hypothetical protein [Gammaproteobacteria bacterium]
MSKTSQRKETVFRKGFEAGISGKLLPSDNTPYRSYLVRGYVKGKVSRGKLTVKDVKTFEDV